MDENYILAKWLSNEITNDELAQLEQSQEFADYQKIKNYSSQLEVSGFDEQSMLSSILKSKKQEAKIISIKNNNWFLKIAAVLVIGFGLFYSYQNFVPQTQIAVNGNKTNFLLPDNSEVVLNSGSKIEYKKWNWNKNRNLNLQGEAYFHVAKGKKFEVTTNLGKVAVLGTQFDVKARKKRFDVTCFEGRVKVNYNNTEIVLTHGQSVTFENGKQTNSLVENKKPDWTQNQITFNNEKLRNILDEIERQFDITIELNVKNNEQLFSGKIPTDNLEVALQIISTTYNLKHTNLTNKKIIFEKK